MHLIIIRELNITNRGYKAQKCYHLKSLNKLVSENILEVRSWNNGKSGAKLDLTSSTTTGLQIHKFDHTRTANPCDWLPCRHAVLSPLPCLFTSPSC